MTMDVNALAMAGKLPPHPLQGVERVHLGPDGHLRRGAPPGEPDDAKTPWDAEGDQPESDPPPGFFDDAPGDSSSVEGRVPPHDLDAEGAVLSAVMVDPGALAKVEFLKPEHFYSEAHRRIFEAALAVHADGASADVVTVATRLRDTERLAQIGGMVYLTTVLNSAPAVANVAAYGATVHAKWRLRQLLLTCQRVTSQAYAGVGDVVAFVDGARDAVVAIAAAVPVDATSTALLDGPALAAPLPALEYVVADIGLVAGGGAPHLVAGYGFSGKTLAVQSMALSLAAGRPVWGAYGVRDRRRVIHIDLEQGERLTRRRYQRLARAMGVDLEALGDALVVAVMPPLQLSATYADRWRAMMEGRDLAIIDSFRAATGGQDENSSDIRAGLDMLGQLSEQTGCRALGLHHARKGGPDDPGGRYAIRGSSAIFDAVDSAYLFTAAKGEPIGVEHVKARSHGEPIAAFALVIADVEVNGDPRAGVSVEVRGAELVAARREEQAAAARASRAHADAEVVRSVLRDQPGIGARDLRAQVRLAGGLGYERLGDALAHLGDAVDIRDEVKGRSRVARHYLRGAS
jgi:hypothetical protein